MTGTKVVLSSSESVVDSINLKKPARTRPRGIKRKEKEESFKNLSLYGTTNKKFIYGGRKKVYIYTLYIFHINDCISEIYVKLSTLSINSYLQTNIRAYPPAKVTRGVESKIIFWMSF